MPKAVGASGAAVVGASVVDGDDVEVVDGASVGWGADEFGDEFAGEATTLAGETVDAVAATDVETGGVEATATVCFPPSSEARPAKNAAPTKPAKPIPARNARNNGLRLFDGGGLAGATGVEPRWAHDGRLFISVDGSRVIVRA
jgi:hypothetical protein